MKRSYTFYNQKSGAEIYGTQVRKKEELVGRIALKLFPLEKGKEKIILMLLPEEAFRLALSLEHAVSDKKGIATLIVHKREKDETELTTTLHIDYWEKDRKQGWGITLVQKKKGAEKGYKLSVSLSKPNALFLSELLRKWSVEQAFKIYDPADPAMEESEIPF